MVVSPAAPIRLTAILRIIQEALTNATKHGHATPAVIETRENAPTVELSVRDDGDGFDPTVSTCGFGLRGVRERVELIRATVQVGSSAGEGTTVTASFPAQRRPVLPRAQPPGPPAEPVRVWSAERGAGSCSS